MDQNIKKRTKTDFSLKNGLWGEKGTIWEPCKLEINVNINNGGINDSFVTPIIFQSNLGFTIHEI